MTINKLYVAFIMYGTTLKQFLINTIIATLSFQHIIIIRINNFVIKIYQ